MQKHLLKKKLNDIKEQLDIILLEADTNISSAKQSGWFKQKVGWLFNKAESVGNKVKKTSFKAADNADKAVDITKKKIDQGIKYVGDKADKVKKAANEALDVVKDTSSTFITEIQKSAPEDSSKVLKQVGIQKIRIADKKRAIKKQQVAIKKLDSKIKNLQNNIKFISGDVNVVNDIKKKLSDGTSIIVQTINNQGITLTNTVVNSKKEIFTRIVKSDEANKKLVNNAADRLSKQMDIIDASIDNLNRNVSNKIDNLNREIDNNHAIISAAIVSNGYKINKNIIDNAKSSTIKINHVIVNESRTIKKQLNTKINTLKKLVNDKSKNNSKQIKKVSNDIKNLQTKFVSVMKKTSDELDNRIKGNNTRLDRFNNIVNKMKDMIKKLLKKITDETNWYILSGVMALLALVGSFGYMIFSDPNKFTEVLTQVWSDLKSNVTKFVSDITSGNISSALNNFMTIIFTPFTAIAEFVSNYNSVSKFIFLSFSFLSFLCVTVGLFLQYDLIDKKYINSLIYK